MTGLPASVEAYLQEAGFSQTEILILKRLIEGEAMTLRELAAKTGKSTGVLDQATKKLLGKKILSKEQINDGLKYTLGSVQAITTWVQKDMQEKKDNLQRKHQNFETFISSITVDRNRPDMEYFEGEEGIKKAYLKLLEMGCKEFLQYFPVEHKEEEDPLCAFRVQYFRERRKRGIFSRVITHDTLLGRRFQSRDVFEYRKTVLVPEDRCPFQFEQIICCNTVACFDHKDQKVCFIKFAQLAEAERKFFEAVWQHPAESPNPNPSTEEQVEEAQEIPVQTRTLSGLREFFLSRKSIVTFAMLAVLSGIATYGLYVQNLSFNKERVREQVRAIAATAAPNFEAADLEKIKSIEDISKVEWSKVVGQLQNIRISNKDVRYVYILRPTTNPDVFEFVADADSLDPFAIIDLNQDGVIDEADTLNGPGTTYEVAEVPAAIEGLNFPSADKDPYTDKWGTFISGFAPIKNSSGTSVAVLGVDRIAEDIKELTLAKFAPLYYFFGFFGFFIFVRLSAFNRSLYKEILLFINQKNFLYGMIVVFLILLIADIGMYSYTNAILKEQIRNKLESIAATAALQFNAQDLQVLQIENDWQRPEWAKVVGQLREIRENNKNIVYAYILRKNPNGPQKIDFVADSHSLNPYANSDDNPNNDVDSGDGLGSSLLAWPGQPYEDAPEEIFEGFVRPTASQDFYEDAWGTLLSGYAPIKDNQGNTVAVIAIDISAASFEEYSNQSFSLLFWVLGVSILLIGVRLGMLHKDSSRKVLMLLAHKKVLYSLLCVLVLSVIISVGMYYYTLSIL